MVSNAWGYHIPFELDILGIGVEGHEVHVGDVIGGRADIGSE